MQQNSLQVMLSCSSWFIQPKMLAEPISVAAPDLLQGNLISVALRLCSGCLQHLRWAVETLWLCLLLLMILIPVCRVTAVSTITKLLFLSLMFSAGCAGGTEIGQERSNCSMRLWMRSCISKEILQEKLWGDTRLFWEQRFPKMSSIFSSEWNRVDFWWYLWDHFRKNLPLAILAKNFFHPLNETTKSSSQYI